VKPDRCSEHRAIGGFTLIDVLVLMVMVSAVAASLTGIFSRMAQDSAQALRERQASQIAEALLAEMNSMPFTYCDAQDARAGLATGAFVGGTGCAAQVDALGPEPGESRYGPVNRFDGLTDYNGFTMPGPGCAGLCDRNGFVLNGPGSALAGCNARVTMIATPLPGIAALDANGRPQALRITVAVDCGSTRTALEAIRTRHAPNQV
jgi:MSHA pilin protein MshD